MSQSRRSNPKYRHYRPKNLGVVRIDGKDHYLGRYDSPESWEKYYRLIAEWLSRSQADGPEPAASAKPNGHPVVSVNELLLAYWPFVESYYVKDGKPTPEQSGIRDAIWPLRQLYGSTKAADFGPKSLQAIRQHMIDEQNLSRKVVNQRIGRIKRVFKWAVAQELVPPTVFYGLLAIAGLRFGRTEARETEPVKPVDDQHVDATLPFVTPHVSAMIQVQRLTGVRPDDVVSMRPRDIDQSEEVWIYERRDHKNRWRGHRRLIPIGPKAQAVVKPFMDRDPEAYLFSPKESEAWRLEHRPAYFNKERKTKVYPCELRARAAKKEVRRDHGVEAAQVVLGHARADVTQVYAEKNLRMAIEIARQSG